MSQPVNVTDVGISLDLYDWGFIEALLRQLGAHSLADDIRDQVHEIRRAVEDNDSEVTT